MVDTRRLGNESLGETNMARFLMDRHRTCSPQADWDLGGERGSVQALAQLRAVRPERSEVGLAMSLAGLQVK